MQTCSICNACSPDNTTKCKNCNANLQEFSTTAVALIKFQANPRVKAVRLSIAHDACPNCNELFGTYKKNEAPRLPCEECSHEKGCRCFYEPVLEETAIVGKIIQ